VILVAAAMLVAEPIAAARTPDSTPQQPTAAINLPAGTPLRLKSVGPINSRAVRQGQRFALELADDVIAGSSVAIPRGTPAVGEVEAVSGTGMFGKAARLVLRPLFVEVGGQRVNLVGMTNEKGKDATAGAAVNHRRVWRFRANYHWQERDHAGRLRTARPRPERRDAYSGVLVSRRSPSQAVVDRDAEAAVGHRRNRDARLVRRIGPVEQFEQARRGLDEIA
jgi:hypothetical protein